MRLPANSAIRERLSRLLNRSDFQIRIIFVTYLMVLLVVLAGWVAISQVIVPAMERGVQQNAWSMAQGVLQQVREVPVEHRAALLEDGLSSAFKWIPQLAYVQILDGKKILASWVREDKYRLREDVKPIHRSGEGDLLLVRVADEVIYEGAVYDGGAGGEGGGLAARVGVSAVFLENLKGWLFKVLLIVTFLMLGVSFFLIRWFSAMITRPVDRLLRMTHLLSTGQLDRVIEEMPESPPCWQPYEEGSDFVRESDLARAAQGPEFCPYLRQSDVGHSGCRGVTPFPSCKTCRLYQDSLKDELARLVFAFQYMAGKIRVYQEKLKQHYEFEDRLLETCPDGIMANDMQGRIILYNKGAERLLGYPREEVLQKFSVREIYPNDEASAVKRALLCDDFGGPGVLLDYATRLIRKDGTTIPIRLSAILLLEGTRQAAVVGFFHDLTELQSHVDALLAANDQLNRTNEDLARLNHQYIEMLSFVTHELKSPIANTYMSANALRQEIFGTLSPDQTRMIEIICRNLDQSMEMIRHYLDLSRIEKNELLNQPQETSILSEVVEPVLEALTGTIQERKVSVRTDVPPDLKWTLDPELFRGVFTNLVSNALKYGKESGEIRISARDLGDRCHMEVWNSGPGIREEDMERLFQKFQRLQPSRFPSTRGTGLGLFITRTVVERHGGRIWVESREGEWVNFIIELPRGDAVWFAQSN